MTNKVIESTDKKSEKKREKKIDIKSRHNKTMTMTFKESTDFITFIL